MGLEINTDGPGIDMAGLFSPFYWGFVISLFCSGITVVQAYLYFPHPTDGRVIQTIAVVMLILDLASSALIAQSLYYYLIPHYGSLAQLNSVTLELSTECLISSVITFISQMFFVYQIYKVNHASKLARALAIIIAIGAAFTLIAGSGCVWTMVVFQHGVLANRNKTFATTFGVAKGVASLTDIIATVSMYFLLSASKTGITQTNQLVNSLMTFFVNRGVLVTVVQLMTLIMFYAIPDKLYWLSFHINVTRLYANTFFAMLNARKHLRTQMSKGHSAMEMSAGHYNSHSDSLPEHGPAKRHFENEAQIFDSPMVTKSVYTAHL
ncbi:hypothetical protein L218DRAFT_955480 [Marasmius fiardii PR-910]|nr:hypothetical protein L218DRAFT_955480 [Marasmius fiardii PR-910]